MSVEPTTPQNGKAGALVYVFNASRAHKLLPLLEDYPVSLVRGWSDVFKMLRHRSRRPRAILIDGFGRFGVLGITLSTLLRAPLVLRLRGEFYREEADRFAAQRGLRRWWVRGANWLVARVCFARARIVVFNSAFVRSVMTEVSAGKQHAIVYNPVSLHVPADVPGTRREGGLRLLTITNMNLWAKVEPLIEAIEESLPSELWETLDLRWDICGTGRHEPRLLAAASDPRLGGRVRLHGNVGDVERFYADADVLVHLTRMDAFPNVPMEAMVFGKPVITNVDSCGTREQVTHGINGFVVGSPAELESALRQYSADPQLRIRHGEAGRELVLRRFSVRAQRAAMAGVIESLESSSEAEASVCAR